jgi:alanine-glyoxylate transaminase/serine-glyoxylate transaminase/serine-pyruvate transaminase
MNERELLMIPGPTNVDPTVLRALSKPTISHVSPGFAEIFKETLDDLRKVFMTNDDVLVVAGSGTLAMEMAIANIVEPGDKILNLVSGTFGQRFVEVSRYHGATPEALEARLGDAVTPESVEAALKKDRYKAVTVVHVDTSTGVTNPIREIGEVVHEHGGAYYVVDTVCSLGGMEARVGDWNIDICLSGSQKCIGVPPGLALLSVRKNVVELLEKRKSPVGFYYGDFKNWLPIMRDPSKYFATPPVNMIYALHTALKLVLAEGLEKRFSRHDAIASVFRNAIKALGLRIVAEEGHAANTITAVYYPERVEDQAFRSNMKQCGVVVAGGLGSLKGKTFRVGHMGNVNQNDIMATISAVESALQKTGYKFDFGAGLRAAQEQLHR